MKIAWFIYSGKYLPMLHLLKKIYLLGIFTGFKKISHNKDEIGNDLNFSLTLI